MSELPGINRFNNNQNRGVVMSGRFNGQQQHSAHSSMHERLLYIGGGILIFAMAIIVAVVIYSYNEVEARQTLTSNSSDPSDVAFGTMALLSPAKIIPAGTKLNDVPLVQVNWPRTEVPEGAVRDAADMRDMYAKVDLQPNQPIIKSSLSSVPIIGGVADIIPPGHRATTIEVDSTSGVEGWATPGAHVDVIVTYQDSTDGKKKSQIAIEDAVVVSYNGQTKVGDTKEGTIGRLSQTATVTLAVPVMDAVKLHTARAMGKISLILRNTSDVRSVGDALVTSTDLSKVQPDPKKSLGDPQGFVRYKDGKGGEMHMELRDKKWWELAKPTEQPAPSE
ncbi:Flp pilus assembly protein CpaB [bacterium]|nr:Flp pilus assembly protein CpaB [bacterium]